MDCGLPLFASTIATPVLRKEASMASTRIYRNVKIDCDGFNTESTNSKATVLLERSSNGRCDQQEFQNFCGHPRDDIHHARDRSKILRDDKRAKSNCDAGSGIARRLFVKFPNTGQTHCQSLSTARGAGLDRLG